MRLYAVVIAISAWFALILQFPLTLAQSRANGISIADGALNYFSYFTILTNLLVAVALTFPGRFLARANVRSALAVYITVVGGVYLIVLRPLWNSQGLQKLADVILHYVVPALYLPYWLLSVQQRLPWRSCLPWLLYPTIYALYSLLRGAVSGWYPYPFLNADSLGYNRVMANAGLLLLVFAVLSILAIAVTRKYKKGETIHVP